MSRTEIFADLAMEMQKVVAQRILARRTWLGWTQSKLAEQAGCSERAIRAWESGVNEIMDVGVRQRLAQALGVKYEKLFWQRLPDRTILLRAMRGMTIGTKLHYLCAVRGITIRELAAFMRVNRNTPYKVFKMNTLDDLNNAMRRRTIDALRQVIGLSEKALMSLLVDVVEENPTELIAQKIQKRRMELKMTQQELADKVGVLRETVVNWETGKHRVTISLRQDLAKALLMEYGDLFWRQLPNEEDRRKLTSGMTLGERVLFLREFQWISRKEVAMFAAVDVHTVFAYDNTKRTTANKDSSILQIAIVLRVSVEELLCE